MKLREKMSRLLFALLLVGSMFVTVSQPASAAKDTASVKRGGILQPMGDILPPPRTK
jgi:hypothetical protein